MRIVAVAVVAMLSAAQAPAPPPAPATYMTEQALMATLKAAETAAPAMHTAPVKLAEGARADRARSPIPTAPRCTTSSKAPQHS